MKINKTKPQLCIFIITADETAHRHFFEVDNYDQYSNIINLLNKNIHKVAIHIKTAYRNKTYFNRYIVSVEFYLITPTREIHNKADIINYFNSEYKQ